MGSWRGVDRRAAAINALRDYSTMQTIIDTTDDDLKAIAEDIPHRQLTQAGWDAWWWVPTPTGAEERIMAHLERIDNRQRRYLQTPEQSPRTPSHPPLRTL